VGYILLWNYCDSGVYFALELLRQCGISTLSQQFQSKVYPTVATVPKQNIPHCRNSSKTELLRQCGIFCFGAVGTMGYILFWNCYDSEVYFRTVPKPNIKIVERGKIDTIKNKYMTAHFPGLEQALK
jgi:hypothetical protein